MTDFYVSFSMSRLFETQIQSIFCHRTAEIGCCSHSVATPISSYGVIEIQHLQCCKKQSNVA